MPRFFITKKQQKGWFCLKNDKKLLLFDVFLLKV
jgi:hypothetical protein